MPLEIDLSNEVAIVTGGASGIGAGISRALVQADAVVEGCDLSGGNGTSRLDVTDMQALAPFVEQVAARHGRIDIVVSCARANVFTGASDCAEADWERNQSLNLTSHWQLGRLCKPYLERDGKGVSLVCFSGKPVCGLLRFGNNVCHRRRAVCPHAG